jgi:uncharacterized membrane protein YkoI
MKPVRYSLLALATLVLAFSGAAAGAHERPPSAARTVSRRTAPPRPQLSMDQAVQIAQRRFRARVVRAETQTQGGRTIYVLRMLDGAGRVFAVRVDALSGAIL